MRQLFLFFALGFASLYSEERKVSCKEDLNLSCECLEQGLGLPRGQNCFPAAYNTSANIDLRSCWDLNLYASFLYWNVSQEGMETSVQIPNSTSVGTFTKAGFKYHPGFKVGIGVNLDYDNWTSFLEYTWMHGNSSNTNRTDTSSQYYPGSWKIRGTSITTSSSVSSKWTMNLDQLDVAISRPYYLGERLTISPIGGLRGLWIRQKIHVAVSPQDFKARSNSWAVGPMIGAQTNWLLDCGFRFEGKAGGSLVYTKYTTISQSEALTDGFYSSQVKDLSFVRPTANLGAGIGWGTYTVCKKYYVDLAARYDFNVLWNQNVMAYFVNGMNGYLGTAPDLFMHGLTLTMRVDF